MKRFLTLLTIALSLAFINQSCKPQEEEFFIAQGCGPGGCDLIVDIEDLGKYKWLGEGYYISNENMFFAIKFSENDGMVNMDVLKDFSSDLSVFPAAQQCSLKGEGWYLPSKTELQKIIQKYPDKFSDGVWWSSTFRGYYYKDDENYGYAWALDEYGTTSFTNKVYDTSVSLSYRVCAVKRAN